MLTQVEFLKKYDLKIRGHLGQHLLMDPNTIRKIVDGLELEPGDRVFEIGPGLGAVTREVLERGFPVLAVEKDKKFVEVLTQEFVPVFGEQLQIAPGDILETDLKKIVNEGAGKNKKVKVIGNLPYYISTPILFHLIESATLFSRAVLMLQKEVAARMTAKPGEEDYGRLSVSSSLFGKTETLFDVSPKCFLPAPEVTSRVIRFTFCEEASHKDQTRLLRLIQIAFSQRRKTLLSLLVNQWEPRPERQTIEKIFEGLGYSLKVRGEELSREQFVKLAAALEKER